MVHLSPCDKGPLPVILGTRQRPVPTALPGPDGPSPAPPPGPLPPPERLTAWLARRSVAIATATAAIEATSYAACPMSSLPLPPPSPLAARIHGVYAITADEADTDRLLTRTGAALDAGIRVLQYRNKLATTAGKREQLMALKALCDRHQCLLIVNDDWRLALALGLEAVHLGQDDGDLQEARAALGPAALIGVSCYASLDRARELAPLADYLAFGALFPSGTKPQAASASLAVLTQARALDLGRPIVGIGGISAANIAQVLAAGADAGAVIGALFNQPDVGQAARRLLTAAASTAGPRERPTA